MNKATKRGVVVETQKGFVFICEFESSQSDDSLVILETEIWLARTKSNFSRPKKFNNICIGDTVEFEPSSTVDASGLDLPTARIASVEKRKNALVKPTRRAPKDFAVNFEKLLILEDLVKVNAGFLCRYLCLAELQGIDSVVIGNKSDIGEDKDGILRYLEMVGIRCMRLSAKESSGDFEILRELTSKGIHVLVGRSGVGKSSLLNAMGPKLVQATDDLRSNNFGRHVTSYASMHKVSSGGWLVDSPGIQVLTLKGYAREDIRWGFIEFERFAKNCKFRNCLHILEKDCGVKMAVDSGDLPQWRYKSYASLIKEWDQQ